MKKVCIMGTSNSLKLAPLGDKSFEFWALNDMFALLPEGAADRWFLMDPRERSEELTVRGRGSYKEWHKTITIPIYMQKQWDDMPTSIAYPLEEISRHFNRRLFKSSIDYMVALALFEGFKEIHIYGVDMAVGEEYGHQRPSLFYWIGRAEGMGVKIVLPEISDLMKEYFLYGYDDEKRSDFRKKGEAKAAELAKNAAEFQKNYYLSLGAKDTWDFILREIGGE